jgi:ribosomal protein S12 methylthiotransferase accessory factor
LFELIERDAVALWWHGGVPPMEIPEASLAAPRQSLAQARQKLDGRQTTFLALQSIANIPAVCAISFDADGKNLALGFGAAESYDAAASKALMELLQMEVGNRLVSMKIARLGLGSLSAPDRAIHDRLMLLDKSMPPFQTSGIAEIAPEISVAAITSKLGDQGVQMFAVDLCRDQTAVKAVKLIAPALQPLPGHMDTRRLASAKKTNAMRLQHFPKVAIL